ncbi:hypothetical protein GCM10022384_46730 [Streptomyces marokkonensis]|uniref:Uncharacterized protein n=1 Tax=Streptomyces marokkonensis TaxID=324855 RepID=A0ABP7R817_9ACTN
MPSAGGDAKGAETGVAEGSAETGVAEGSTETGAAEDTEGGADEWCVAGMTAPVRVNVGGRMALGRWVLRGYVWVYRRSLPTLFGWAIRHFVTYSRVCRHTRRPDRTPSPPGDRHAGGY